MEKNKYFDKEKFLKDIYSMPAWVTNEARMLKYIIHIHYRLYQAKGEIDFMRNLITDEQYSQLLGLSRLFDEAYKNDPDTPMKVNEDITLVISDKKEMSEVR